jgi:hypothetical protein
LAVQAVLFDVGGPLDTEVQHEEIINEHIKQALAIEGFVVTYDAWIAAERGQ